MKLRCVYSIFFGLVILFPSLLFAQFDPTSVLMSQAQPIRSPQQTPSTPSAQDSAPNAGDVGQVM
jgi:hypothetical protein